jgi:hypothetical protein
MLLPSCAASSSLFGVEVWHEAQNCNSCSPWPAMARVAHPITAVGPVPVMDDPGSVNIAQHDTNLQSLPASSAWPLAWQFVSSIKSYGDREGRVSQARG